MGGGQKADYHSLEKPAGPYPYQAPAAGPYPYQPRHRVVHPVGVGSDRSRQPNNRLINLSKNNGSKTPYISLMSPYISKLSSAIYLSNVLRHSNFDGASFY